MTRLRGRLTALVLSVAAVAAAGCGSSSKSNSAAKPATTPAAPQAPSTPGTTSTTAANGYTRQVDTAVAPLISAIAGAKANPLHADAWDQVSKAAGPAKAKVAALKPPAAVAQLQPQLVALLGRIETDAASARDAIAKHDSAAQHTAGQKVAEDGKELTALAGKFKAAGYPI